MRFPKRVYCYYKYSNIEEMLEQLYKNKPLSHPKYPSSNLKVGDVVTTNCGFDLGFVAETSPNLLIYSRNYRGYSLGFAPYGAADLVDWYVIGENISLEEWKNACCQKHF